jgi:hypothetical protein
MHPFHPLVAVKFALLSTAIACGTAAADDSYPKFQIGAEIGGGVLERKFPESRTDAKFYLAFKGGYRPTERLLLGVELGGFTIQAGSRWESGKGAGISQRFVIAQYRLQPGGEGWYLKGGAGYVRYWDNRPGSIEDDGRGALVALGRDWTINGFGRIGPLLVFSRGDSDRIEHRGTAMVISWSYP